MKVIGEENFFMSNQRAIDAFDVLTKEGVFQKKYEEYAVQACKRSWSRNAATDATH